MRGLYAICDAASLAQLGLDVFDFARAVLPSKPCALQYRAKHACTQQTLAHLRALSILCRHAAVPLVVNDRPDLALLSGCDFVHLGQTDMPVASARRLGPHLRIGISTHTLEQVREAVRLSPAYVAFGPVFSTTSKKDAEPVVGKAALVEATKIACGSGVPLVAIGGITLAEVDEVAPVADAVAMIQGLLPVPGESAEGLFARITARADAVQGHWLPRATAVPVDTTASRPWT